jgi:hypothetical protein
MRRAILGFAVLTAVACRPVTTELTDEQRKAIAAEVDSLTTEWWAAWAAIDLERGLSFLDDGPGMTWAVEGAPTVHSVAEAREAWGPMIAGLLRQDLQFTNARTVVLARDVVWTLRELRYAAVDTTGAVVAEGRSIETAVWVKRGGGWRLMLGHDS